MTAKCYPKKDGLCLSKLAKIPLLWKLHCRNCRHKTENIEKEKV